ncbi:hypothetical protein Lnau_0162 [Legionella nautarum]|uniref:Leucine-rich repeat domain-containing protein n=1 Tax=Legionella nautarum TaxID=45070 RepID=A0A0W0X473_9GAMM|nr:leucine-rich repeat domain-containing protein [Legionella nautarum]KTD39395.1 hypothetical protein Lnau_0162 [Legionella nautarum]
MRTRIGPNGLILVKVDNDEINEDGSFDIPEDIAEIDERAFVGCMRLIELNMPDSVLTIGDEAFDNCKNLKKVGLSNHLISIGFAAFAGCGIEQLDIPDSVTGINGFAFSGCKDLTSIKLPVNLNSLPFNVFDGCENLEEVILPEKLLSIGTSAFGYCNRLKKISLPIGLTVICNYLFTRCIALEEVVIPEGVTLIDSRVFNGCIALKQVSIPESITSIKADAFLNSEVEVIFIDTSNEEERTRIANLLPTNLKTKVVMYSRSELTELWGKELRRIIDTAAANPLYSLMPKLVKSGLSELPNEVLVHINQFLGPNNPCYQEAVAAIKRVPLPRIQDGEEGKRAYKERIEKIVNDCIKYGKPSESYSFQLTALTATAAVGGLALGLAALVTVLVAGAIPLAATLAVASAASLTVAAGTFFYHSRIEPKEESVGLPCFNSLPG